MIFNTKKKKLKIFYKNEKYIAIHYRGRDKEAQGGINKKISEIKKAIKEHNITNIFVATDNPNFFNIIYEKIKNINLFRYTNPPLAGRQIHYNKKDFKPGENLYKAILDMYTCKKATYFIPSLNSGFSDMVRDLD